MRHDSAGEAGNSTFLHIPPGRALCRLRRKGAEAVKKRSNFPDFVPENDDFSYQDGYQDNPQGDSPDEYDPNWADDDDPVEVAGGDFLFRVGECAVKIEHDKFVFHVGLFWMQR